MRIGLVTTEFPLPRTAGLHFRYLSLIRGLSELGDLWLFSFAEPGQAVREEELETLRENCANIRVARLASETRVGKARRYLSALRRGMHPLSYRYFQPRLQGEVLEFFEEANPNVVFLEYSFLGAYVDLLAQRLPNALTVIDAHDVETFVHQELGRGTGDLFSRLKFSYLAPLSRKLESEYFRKADMLLTTSPVEADRAAVVIGSAGTPVRILPNVVDMADYPDSGGPPEETAAVFIGNYDWQPNREAARVLVDSIWPRVSSQIPEARLWLVGKNPPSWLKELDRRNGIDVLGFVPDVRPFLQKAAVVVTPLLQGGGIKLKVLEAFASRKAVVATPKAAEGIVLEDGVHALIAQLPAFADAICRVFRDPGLRKQLGDAARELVEAEYSQDAFVACLSRLLQELESGRPARPGAS